MKNGGKIEFNEDWSGMKERREKKEEENVIWRIIVDMEGLRIIFEGERDDLIRGKGVGEEKKLIEDIILDEDNRENIKEEFKIDVEY